MADRVPPPAAPDGKCDMHKTGEEATIPLAKKHELKTTSEDIVNQAVRKKVARAHARADRNTRVSRAVRLSPEAIATIVSFLDGLSARMAASQVCHRWRDVALSIPRLWSNVSVHELVAVNFDAQEPYRSDHRHCAYEYRNPARAVISSNLHQISLLLGRSAKAPVELYLRSQAHRDSALEGSELTTEDVRKLIKDSTNNGTVYEKDRLAKLFPGTVNPVVDVLMHASGLADRLTSLSLRICCSSWFFLFACLPPMLALKTLIISDDPDRNRLHIGKLYCIPKSFWQLLQTESTSALPIAFPALETLQVSGIPGRTSILRNSPRLSISQRRIESLLCLLPSLKRLDLGFNSWPDIEPEVKKFSAKEGRQSGLGNGTQRSGWSRLPDLRHVRLCSDASDIDQDIVTFGHIADLLQLNADCSLQYEAVDGFRNYDKLLSVFSIDDFRPKTLTFTRYEEGRAREYWKMSAKLCAIDVEGSTRTAVATITSRYGSDSSKLFWTGDMLNRYIDTSILTSLAVDMISWKQLAADLVAPALENLTFVISMSFLYDAAYGRNKPPTTSHLLPRTVTFAVDKSIPEELDSLRLGERPLWRFDFGDDSDSESDWDEDYTPQYYKVPFSVFVRLLQVVHKPSGGAGKLDKLIIARELKVMPKRAGAEALARFSDSVVML